jgi:hypothetical protein
MNALLTHQRQLLGIAKSWALKNLPGWCDECHRDLLARHGATVKDGRVSALTMKSGQIAAVLKDYEARGWPSRNQKSGIRDQKAVSVPPRIAHMVRLWGRLGQAGKVERATRPALLAFCARQTRHEVPDLDSLSVAECTAITEALKSWLNRPW